MTHECERCKTLAQERDALAAELATAREALQAHRAYELAGVTLGVYLDEFYGEDEYDEDHAEELDEAFYVAEHRFKELRNCVLDNPAPAVAALDCPRRGAGGAGAGT